MILVTGATGFLGSNLLLKLLYQNANTSLRAIYRSEESLQKAKNFFQYHNQSQTFDRIDWIQADILDIPKLSVAFEGVEFVYHCAALISFDPADEEKLRKTNIEGTANVVNYSFTSISFHNC